MSCPGHSSSSSRATPVRINGKIRAREVRVIGPEGNQIGILSLHEAIKLARAHNMDLVEVAPNANPPVCRIIDYGKFRYEQAKKEKESRKHQHANRVKEIQLSASIDPHDLKVKLGHAIDFLCDDMRVMVTLRFRGREMAHQEIGRQVIERFIADLAPYGSPVGPPRLEGKGLRAMITPLPRHKRAPNPRAQAQPSEPSEPKPKQERPSAPSPSEQTQPTEKVANASPSQDGQSSGFVNNPFAELDGSASNEAQN